MAYLKPQSPIQVNGGDYIYPLTTTDQIIDSDTNAQLDIIDKIYPVGSIYVSATNTNPSAQFGGTWTLVDKQFAQYASTSTSDVTLNTTNCTSIANYALQRAGHTTYIKLSFTNAVAVTDSTIEMFTIAPATMGATSIYRRDYSIFSDGGNACVTLNMTSAGVFRTGDSMVRGSSTASLRAGTSIGIWEFIIPHRYTNMRDDCCDKFFFRRTA
jgi:hypothetical protein